jgi:hypothetical protein
MGVNRGGEIGERIELLHLARGYEIEAPKADKTPRMARLPRLGRDRVFCDIGIGKAITPRANTFERSCSHQAREKLRMHSDGRRVVRPNDSTPPG